MSEQPRVAPARKSRFTWVRAVADRVPTAWFAAIGTGVFLAATAAFGGLATAAEPPLAHLRKGAAHVNDMRSLTVERAVLIDELPGSGTFPEDGQRVLAIVVDVENNWDEPIRATGAVQRSFSVAGLDEPSSAARMDDATIGPTLQPGVPAQLVYTWIVDDDEYAAGDRLTVRLDDLTLYTGTFVTRGSDWEDPVASATLTLTIQDVGAGVDQEDDNGS
ncbi:hypothetical protein [Microbacterium kyungheense]|uniref:DUF4352 domain-containing protein n=1 Tax=Microbacterium kyungheense TaxID=1263636 RepID=A0A543EQ13_9MICO|nr:hypothetical protein [Microbacterium kyungheense]TQM23670.1 hypothetical protein FB391_3060 [Microbacterium kyungheense]